MCKKSFAEHRHFISMIESFRINPSGDAAKNGKLTSTNKPAISTLHSNSYSNFSLAIDSN